jgi:abortive infection bacteriophage resistance protein
VRFQKPALSIEQQADLVLSRGLHAARERLIRRLHSVGYYRLCGYWHHLKQPDDSFQAGSDFEAVWLTYNFDRRLRVVVMEAIERVEVAIRCDLYTRIVLRHGPFGHLDPAHFPNVSPEKHQNMLNRLRDEARRSNEQFVQHFRSRYDEFPDLPLWAAAEISTFGTVLTMVNGSESDIRPAIAAKFNLHDAVFASWLLTLNTIRNVCAHHSRLWNRELGLKPQIPNVKNGPLWHGPIRIQNNRIFVVLTMLGVLQQYVAPRSRWRQRVFDLFDGFPNVPLAPMGMPADWRNHPLWR